MPLSEQLLEIMVCPACKQRVIYFPRGEADRSEADGFVLCPASRLRYALDEARFPVFLIDEATAVPPDEVERLVARARALGLPVP